jgi:hypothetical protein
MKQKPTGVVITTEPKVEIRKLQTFKGHDGIGVNADVHINGIKCMYVHDGAYGGELEINTYSIGDACPKDNSIDKNEQLLIDYLNTLPNTISLEDYINDLINTELIKKATAKNDKKFAKVCEQAICVGIPGNDKYSYLKSKFPLKQIPKDQLQLEVNLIEMQYCKKGVVILNKNLEALGISIKKN